MSEIIQRRKLYQEVADRLEALIMSGVFQIGDSLPSERDLMERFGVGRPAVREALMSLERGGLVVISGGERARVTRPTAEGMIAGLNTAVRQWLTDQQGVSHLQDVRALLEVGLASRAAETAAASDIAVLLMALEANEAARGHPADFERTDVSFHFVIAEMSGNPIVIAIHQAMIGWLTEQRTISLRSAGAEQTATIGHRRIFEAIAAHDPAAAGDAMRRHLDDVVRLYWQVRNDREGTGSTAPISPGICAASG